MWRENYLSKKQKARIKGYKRSEYDGKWYHSKKEAAYAQELDWMVKAKELKELTGQCKISLRGMEGKHICNYYVDFKAITVTGITRYIEVKGFETEVWRLKWAMFVQQMAIDEPDAEMEVIK